MNNRRFVLAVLSVMVFSLTSACNKKINGSSMEKYLVSSGEVMKTIQDKDRQMEFANGLDMNCRGSGERYEKNMGHDRQCVYYACYADLCGPLFQL